MRALPFALALIACTPQMEDNSLEAHEAVVTDEGEFTAAALGVVAGTEEGDWTLGLDELEVDYHSPSHADLSLLAGKALTLEVRSTWGGPNNVALWEGEEIVFFAGMGDGSSQFGETRWDWGAELGKGQVTRADVDEESGWGELDVIFHDVVVKADDGDVVALPGEPVSVVLDGVHFRLTVVAAYKIDRGPEWLSQAACGPSDVLLVELIRTEEDPGEPLFRPSAARAPTAGCG